MTDTAYSEMLRYQEACARLQEENDALRLALLQERERCAKACIEPAFPNEADRNIQWKCHDAIRALPSPCDLTEAREAMTAQEKLIACRSSVAFDLIRYEQLLVAKKAGAQYPEAVEEEANRLYRLLSAIDDAAKDGGA